MAQEISVNQGAPHGLWNYSDLLDWHLSSGTRPDTGSSGAVKSWGNQEFAAAVGQVTERSVRNWRRGANLPADPDTIERVLFGDHENYKEWRARLRRAYEAAKNVASDAHAPGQSAPDRDPIPVFPPRPDRCFGRETEVSDLFEIVMGSPAGASALVLGGPGMGKTTITLEVAARAEVSRKFGGHRWFVPLETAKSPEAFEASVAGALGIDPATARFGAVLAQLGEGPALVLLDNLETPWETSHRAEIEARLAMMAAIPTVTLVASFRGYDAVLGVRWAREIIVGPLADVDAKALFRDIARRIPEDDPHLSDLLEVLGGVPLAVSLVAQRAALRDRIQEIWEEWQRVGIALARRQGVEPSPLSSVAQSVGLSLGSCRLHNPGRRLFRWLGQLPTGIAGTDCAALLGVDAFDAESDILAVGLGVLRGNRLDLLPPVRDFARRHEPPEGKDATAWRQHYLSLARDHAARIGFSDGVGIVERLTPELPNIEVAILAALADGDLSGAMEALDGTYRLMVTTGLGSPSVIQQLAEVCHAEGETVDEANCLRRIGNINLRRSDHVTAQPYLERALALYRKAGDVFGEANCIKGLGDILLERSDLVAAQKAFEQAMSLYRKNGQHLGEADCLRGLGEVALARGDYPEAHRAFHQALPIYEEVGGVLGRANCLKDLGEIAQARSEFEVAGSNYAQARELFREVGNKLGEADCLKGLGDIDRQCSRSDLAQLAYEQALDLFRQVRNGLGVGVTLRRLAEVAADADRPELLAAAHKAWVSIGRSDLVDSIESPLGCGPSASARQRAVASEMA